jgi:hypothetical protein
MAGNTPVLVHNDNDIPSPTQVQGRNQPLTNKQADDLAKILDIGRRSSAFAVSLYLPMGRPSYLGIGSGDGSHNGGTWKVANSVDDSGRKSTMLSTTDALLNKIGC